jgi:TonB family protein
MPPPAGSATQAVLTQSATAGRPATTRVAMIEPAPAPPPTPAPTPDTTSPAAKRAAAKAAALAAKQQADAQRAAALEQKRKDQQEKLAAAKEAAAQAAKEKAEAAAAARKAAQQAAAAPPQAPAQVATASTPAPVRAIGPSHAFSASPITGGGPQYPSIYDAEGRSGRVTVSCRIETDGHPNGCRVVSSVGGAAFGQAVMNWLGSGRVRYAPVLRDGQAVAETHQWSMSFQP